MNEGKENYGGDVKRKKRFVYVKKKEGGRKSDWLERKG